MTTSINIEAQNNSVCVWCLSIIAIYDYFMQIVTKKQIFSKTNLFKDNTCKNYKKNKLNASKYPYTYFKRFHDLFFYDILKR